MNNTKIFLTPLFFIFIISACRQKEVEKKTFVASTENTFKTMLAVQRQISGKLNLPGVLQPFEFVSIYPKINGYVRNLPVDRGTIVKHGQVLMTLDAPEIEQNSASAKLKYTQAFANYLTSKDKYERLLATNKTPGTVSQFDLLSAADKMRGDSATAQAEYANFKAMETMKNYLVITAPFDGVITERNVHPGALVGPVMQNAKPILVLQQLSKLRLVADVPEQYATQIKNEAKVDYKINAIPGKSFSGQVARSSHALNNSYRSETIEIDIQNPHNEFKAGMYAEVVLPTTGNMNAFIVPKSAVVTTTERKYIIIIQNKAARYMDITEGNQTSDSLEVFGNFSVGERIIVNASYQIRDGQEINLTDGGK